MRYYLHLLLCRKHESVFILFKSNYNISRLRPGSSVHVQRVADNFSACQGLFPRRHTSAHPIGMLNSQGPSQYIFVWGRIGMFVPYQFESLPLLAFLMFQSACRCGLGPRENELLRTGSILSKILSRSQEYSLHLWDSHGTS